MHNQAIIAAVLLLGVLISGGRAAAEPPDRFLKSMAGTWRGKGTAYISEKAKKTPVRCKITSTFNAKKRQLSNKGRCATAQKKARVSGSIRYSATGKLSGSYISAFGDTRMTGSTGSISGTTLILYSTFVDNSINKVSKIRNVIRRLSKRKFSVTIYEKTGSTYIRRGSITFTK